jgi:predicted HAD superfamily phosphohydrolase
MNREDIIRMAREAGFLPQANPAMPQLLERFAALVASAEREVVANWIMDKGFATGHGDSIVDLLDQLEWQIAEKEREACAKICDLAMLQNQEAINELENDEHIAKCFIQGAMNQLVKTAKAIRARGKA